jgi:hypothetical protein
VFSVTICITCRCCFGGSADLDFILMIQLRIVWRYCPFAEVLTIAIDSKEDGGSQTSSSAVYEGTLSMKLIDLRADCENNSSVLVV